MCRRYHQTLLDNNLSGPTLTAGFFSTLFAQVYNWAQTQERSLTELLNNGIRYVR